MEQYNTNIKNVGSNVRRQTLKIFTTFMICLFSFETIAHDVVTAFCHTPKIEELNLSEKLAIPIKNSNVLSQVSKDKGMIQMALRASLRLLAGEGLELSKDGRVEAGRIAERASKLTIDKASNYPGLQFFTHEAQGVSIMCRLKDAAGGNPRTYFAVINLTNDPKDSVFINVLDEKEFPSSNGVGESVNDSATPISLPSKKRPEVNGSEEKGVLSQDILLSKDDAGYLRAGVSIDHKSAGERLDNLDIPLAIGFFVENPYAVQRMLDHLRTARQSLTDNIEIRSVFVVTPLPDVRARILEIKDELKTFGLDFEILHTEDSDYSDCMYQLEKAALLVGARAVALLNGAIDYSPEHLNNSLKALLAVSVPSVIVSHSDKVKKVADAQNNAIDFTFWTDSDFIKNRFKGESWIDSVWPYIVSSSRVNKHYRVHSGIGDVEHVSIGGQREKWKISQFDQYLLENINGFIYEESPGSADNLLPSDESVIFIEPHQDDLVLRASGLLRRLYRNGNVLKSLRFEVSGGTEDNYYWPPHLEYRDKENRNAFERIGIVLETQTVLVPDESAGNMAEEIELFERKIEETGSNVLVIPGSYDTHRHHARIRYIALEAAQRLVNRTGRQLRVISVPLFSSESEGWDNVNHIIKLSDKENEARREALRAYGSQAKYLTGSLFETRQKAMQDILYGLTQEQQKKDSRYLEGFSDQMMSPGSVFHKRDLALQIIRNRSLTVSFRENGRCFEFLFLKGNDNVRLMLDGKEMEKMTIEDHIVLKHFMAEFITLIGEIDPERGHSSSREIDGIDGKISVIDWIISKGELKPDDKNRENLAGAYREIYESILGKTENIKMNQAWFKKRRERLLEGTLPQNESLYKQRLQEPKKLVIGIATHDSAGLIAKRLMNIHDQIMELSDKFRAWQIEVVLYSNANSGDVDRMTDAMIEQIPGSFFDGLPVRTTVVIKKEPYPNQANAIHQIYRYARVHDADMILFTDDDINYESGAIRAMLERLLRSDGPTLVSGRFYWRARSIDELRKEAEDELSENPIFARVPSRIKELLIEGVTFKKKHWQEIARFRRRPDISFSPQVAMGAGLLMWADHYAGFPYWFPQADVVQRYQYFPFVEIVDKARMSSVPARAFSYLTKKAPRTVQGWKDQINRVFSPERRRVQRDGDFYYSRDIRFSEWVKLSMLDKFYCLANVGIVALARFLSGIIPKSRRKQPNIDERGDDLAMIDSGEAFVSKIGRPISDDWTELRINADQLTVVKANGEEGIFNTHENIQGFKNALLDFFEQTEVDSDHWPLIDLEQLDQLAALYSEEFGSDSYDDIRKFLRVFIVLYAVPDVRAKDLMERLSIGRDELLVMFDAIRNQPVLQELFSEHPTGRHYFSWLRNLVGDKKHTMAILTGTAGFPLSIEAHPSITCNLKCKFCYNRNGLFYEEHLRGEQTLSADKWRSLVREMSENGLKRIDIVGGLEPLLNKEAFLAIIDEAHEYGIKIRVFTNGYAMHPANEEVIKRLLYDNVERVDISLRGGTAETHLGVVGGRDPKDFEKLKNNIKHLTSERDRLGSSLKVSVNFVLVPVNFRELPEMFSLVDELKADIIGLGTNNVIGREQLDLSRFEQADLARMLLQAKEKMDSGRMRRFEIATNESIDRMVLEFKHYGAVPAVYRYYFEHPKLCYNHFMRPVINPYGNIYKCCLVGQPMLALPAGYMGQVIKDGNGIGDIIETTTSHYFRDCPTCNPAEKTGLAVLEKLDADRKAGIPLDKQPIRTAGESRVERAETGDVAFYREKGREIKDYADREDGKLPMPAFEIQKMMSNNDVDMDLSGLDAEQKKKYWENAVEYLSSLKEKGGKIAVMFSVGGASSRMRQGPLPKILIEALQQDPDKFVDPSKFTDQEKRIIHEQYDGDMSGFVRSLDPLEEEHLSVFNRVIYTSKAFLPAGKIGEWYSLDEYGLCNVNAANEALERAGLGRPFIAVIWTSDELYSSCVERFARNNFYGLKVSVKRNGSGQVDIDHNQLSNEMLIYTDTPGYRIVAPLSVVEREKTNTDFFPTKEAYEYARQFSASNGGGIMTDCATVGRGGAEFLAMLGVSSVGSKKPLLTELIRRRVEYGFARTVDNMAMINEDGLAVLGYMLEKDLSLVFEVSHRPKGETGSFFAWIKDVTFSGLKRDARRVISYDSLIASLEGEKDREHLPEDSPINNGAWYFRFPTSDNVDAGVDIFTANLLPGLQDDFASFVKRTQSGKTSPGDSARFQADLRERNMQTPILRTIKDPYLTDADDDQRILTIIMEYSEQSEQDRLLDKTGIVLVPSIEDVEKTSDGSGISLSQVRFDPLKRRATYENPIAQGAREALLKRVVWGPLFSDEFMSTVTRLLKKATEHLDAEKQPETDTSQVVDGLEPEKEDSDQDPPFIHQESRGSDSVTDNTSIADAKEAGLMIPTNTYDGRYMLLVSSNIGTKSELERDRLSCDKGFAANLGTVRRDSGYGDRFDIGMINTGSIDNIVRNVTLLLSGEWPDKRKRKSDQIVVQVDQDIQKKDIATIKTIAPDIRIMRINTLGLKGINDLEKRREYRFNIYAMMLIARRITKVDKGNALYRTLALYLNAHCVGSKQDISEEYIAALTSGEIDRVLDFILSFCPADKIATESLRLFTKTLISA